MQFLQVSVYIFIHWTKFNSGDFHRSQVKKAALEMQMVLFLPKYQEDSKAKKSASGSKSSFTTQMTHQLCIRHGK